MENLGQELQRSGIFDANSVAFHGRCAGSRALDQTASNEPVPNVDGNEAT